MPVYKLKRCRKCGCKRPDPKPKKEAGSCPKCSEPMYYSENWYYTLYHKGAKIEKSGGSRKDLAEDKERQMKLDRSQGKLEKKSLTWEHGVWSLRNTYMIVATCEKGHTTGITGKPPKTLPCEKCGDKTSFVYRGLAPGTVSMYENSLRVLTSYFKGYLLHEIDDTLIQQYKHHRYSMGVGPASVNRDMSTISRILVLNGIKDISVQKDKETKKSRYLKPDEFVRFLEAQDGPVYKDEGSNKNAAVQRYLKMSKMASHVILDTGLRKMAALSLKKGDFDLDRRTVKKTGKGGKESIVPVTERLAEELKAYMLEFNIQSDDQYLFPSPKDPTTHMKDMKKSIGSVLRKAGIKGVTVHDLRRTFGAYFADGTGDLKALQSLLQHSDIKLTNDVYSPMLDGKIHAQMSEYEKSTGHLWGNGAKKEADLSEELKKQLLKMGWKAPD